MTLHHDAMSSFSRSSQAALRLSLCAAALAGGCHPAEPPPVEVFTGYCPDAQPPACRGEATFNYALTYQDPTHRYLDLDPQPDGGFARDIVIEVYGTPEEILRGGGWTWVLTVPVDTVVQTLGGDAEYLPGSRTRGEETCIWRYPFSVVFPPEIAAFDDLGGTFRLVPSIDLGVNVPPTVQVTLLVHDDPPTW